MSSLTQYVMNTYNTYTSPTNFKNGEFHHAVLSISGTVHTLYLDGVQVMQNTNAGNIFATYSTITNTTIGCLTDTTQAFRGFIGDFKVYNKAINASAVSNLYLNRNLVVYYPFDVSVNKYTPNNALLAYDASFVGNATTTPNSVIGTGALTLTNTAGAKASSYVASSPTLNGVSIPFNSSTGLTISCWVNTLGLTNTSTMCLFDIPSATGQKGISVDICGNNAIYSTSYLSNKSNLSFATATQGLNYNFGICINDNYLYALNNSFRISRISLTNPTTDYTPIWCDLSTNTFNSNNSQLLCAVSYGGYLYCNGWTGGGFDSGIIFKVDISNPSIITTFASKNTYGTNTLSVGWGGMQISGTYLYYVNSPLNTISKINLVSPFDYNMTWATSTQGLSYPQGSVIVGNYIYVVNSGTKVVKISLTSPTTDFSNNWIPSSVLGSVNITFITHYSGYLYMGLNNMVNNVTIYKISVTNPTTDYNITWNNQGSNIYNNCGMIVNNGILYISCNVGSLIRTIYIGEEIVTTYSLNNLLSSSYYRHVALSISGTTHTLYLDNSAVAQNISAPNIFTSYPSTISKLLIGSAADLSYGYTGYIDDFKIWGRALPASDISSIYGGVLLLVII